MILYKKIIMTLALLLTAVTGAWAQDTYTITFAANNNTKTVENVTLPKTYQCSYNNADGELDLILKELYGWTGNANQDFCDGETTPTSSDENKVVAGNDNGDHYITINNVFEGTVTITGYYAVNSVVMETPYSLEISFAAAAPATFPFPITWDATNKTTGFSLPAGNVFMNVEYYPVAALTKAPAAKSNIKATTADAIVTAGTVAKIGETTDAQGTLMYYAVQSETAPEAPDYDNKNWSDKVPTAADFNQGNVYVWYYVKGADGDAESTFNDGAITKLGETGYVTLAAAPTYAVTLAEGTEDAEKWTIDPAEAAEGATVTATYNGEKKVKSVKAVVKGPVDLSKLDAPYEARDGEVLTGTLDVANHPVKISIAEGATVTLAGVTINGVNNNSYSWAGITCEGDATIILKDGTTNTVKGFRASYPGIFVPKNKTLIIKGGAQGTGKLIASSNTFQDDGSAGIGAGYEHPCGNIEIQGGDITATGGNISAGIGGSAEGACGNITISGGTIKATGSNNAAGIGSGWNTENGCGNITITGGTIEATGGGYAAGIGSGADHSSCGTIIITNGVTKVTATKGSGAPYSIGAGNGSSCGTVTIGGVVGAISESPYTYPASN